MIYGTKIIKFIFFPLTGKLDFIFPDFLLKVPQFPETQTCRDDEEKEGDGHHTDIAARVEEGRSQGEGDGP